MFSHLTKWLPLLLVWGATIVAGTAAPAQVVQPLPPENNLSAPAAPDIILLPHIAEQGGLFSRAAFQPDDLPNFHPDQSDDPLAIDPTEEREEDQLRAAENAEAEETGGPRDYYVEPRSVGTRRATEPPDYVRTLSETNWPAFEDLNWIDAGLDQRTRFEFRDNDFRRPSPGLDLPFLLRTRAYLGIKEKFDPFRFAIEFEDSRWYNSHWESTDREVNENEIIQMYLELYFADYFGIDRPFRIQAGRMAFEYIDRRLIANNAWRNTTNNFQGFRVIMGQESNDWQIDLLAVQPIERYMVSPDWVNESQWFYAVIGNWRRWSEVITLQPYYLILDQYATDSTPGGALQNLALRGYGIVGETGWDYDCDIAVQYGQSTSGQRQEAFGITTELGYTWEDDPTTPRLSGFFGYGSGDLNPYDDVSQRFDRLFGFGRPWSANDYFRWENLIAPKVRLDWKPQEKLRAEVGYGPFWLASRTDVWPAANRRSPSGQAGDFIGHELDARFRYKLKPRMDLTVGYATFLPGEFPRNTGWSATSNFFYFELSTRLFE